MALIRLLFAISVVLVHLQWFFPHALHGYTILPGLVAVQCFFIVSGFYMSLIINEKYQKTRYPYLLYITNRFLRIYPIYWVVLLILLGFSFFTFGYMSTFSSLIGGQNVPMNFPSIMLGIIKNITLIGTLDNFLWLKGPYAIGLILIQAWTLGLEFLFYLIAPFIVKRSLRIVVVLIILAFVVRTLIWRSHLYPQYDSDYFFLPNLIFFLLGVLAYKLKLRYMHISNKAQFLFLGLFILLTICFTLLPNVHHMKEWTYYIVLTAMVPMLFQIDSIFRVKLLGDIAYPIYVSHFLILSLCIFMRVKSMALVMVSVVAFSILLHYLIAVPIDKVRIVRVKKNLSEDIE